MEEVKKVAHASELAKIKEAGSFFEPCDSFIAGGALTSAFTNQPIKDVDMYFKSRQAFIAAVEQAYDDGLWCVAGTDRAVTFVQGNNVIQLMHFDYFQTPQEIFDAFDFTVCMAAYDIEKEEFTFHDDFMKHAAQRYLKFHSGTRYPFGSLLRVLKYQSRGYTIGKSDLLRIGLCCTKVELNSWDDLARAIGGQYGEKASLDDSVPFSMDAALAVFEKTDFMVKVEQPAMPGTAEELLEMIGVKKADRHDS